jgi:hypothetical protein
MIVQAPLWKGTSVRPGKGLGRLRGGLAGPIMLNCPGDPGCPGNVQPDVAPAPDVQQQIADLWSSVFAMTPTAGTAPAPTATGTLTAWLNANSTMVMGLGLVFGLGFLFLKGRR